MATLRLEVEKSYPNDSGRTIARLGPDAISHLGLNPGDSVEIEGNNTTVVKILRADRQDWNTGIVRIDGFTRQNADIDLGESVEIRKVEVIKADSLTLRPFEESPIQFDSDAAGRVKDKILRRPIRERDIVPVMLPVMLHRNNSSRQAIPLIAVTTEPQGIVRVAPETSVTIQENDVSRD
jgi:transitional endoplasmic reticulum ATPase